MKVPNAGGMDWNRETMVIGARGTPGYTWLWTLSGI